MNDSFDIKYNGNIVGSALVSEMGLYQQIVCRCEIPKEGRYRIELRLTDNTIDLGLCVHYGTQIGTQKRLRRIISQGDIPEFRLVEKDKRHLWPIETPFKALCEVVSGKYVSKEGRGYLLLNEALTKPDSDLNP